MVEVPPEYRPLNMLPTLKKDIQTGYAIQTVLSSWTTGFARILLTFAPFAVYPLKILHYRDLKDYKGGAIPEKVNRSTTATCHWSPCFIDLDPRTGALLHVANLFDRVALRDMCVSTPHTRLLFYPNEKLLCRGKYFVPPVIFCGIIREAKMTNTQTGMQIVVAARRWHKEDEDGTREGIRLHRLTKKFVCGLNDVSFCKKTEQKDGDAVESWVLEQVDPYKHRPWTGNYAPHDAKKELVTLKDVMFLGYNEGLEGAHKKAVEEADKLLVKLLSTGIKKKPAGTMLMKLEDTCEHFYKPRPAKRGRAKLLPAPGWFTRLSQIMFSPGAVEKGTSLLVWSTHGESLRVV